MPKANKSASKSPTKSDFIRKFSASTSASDIVSKAKAANLKLTPSFVYAIRAMDKKRKGGSKAAKPVSAAASAAPSSAASAAKSVNKSAWVRGLPASMSAADVIAKGKAQGIKLTAAQVYTVRANAKRAGDTAPAAANVTVKPKGKPGPKPGSKGKSSSVATAASTTSPAGGHDHHFVNLVLNIGLSKAEALIARLRAKMSAGL
jgi:hypothetical protein